MYTPLGRGSRLPEGDQYPAARLWLWCLPGDGRYHRLRLGLCTLRQGKSRCRNWRAMECPADPTACCTPHRCGHPAAHVQIGAVPGSCIYTDAAPGIASQVWHPADPAFETGIRRRNRSNSSFTTLTSLPGTFTQPGTDPYRNRYPDCFTQAFGST